MKYGKIDKEKPKPNTKKVNKKEQNLLMYIPTKPINQKKYQMNSLSIVKHCIKKKYKVTYLITQIISRNKLISTIHEEYKHSQESNIS